MFGMEMGNGTTMPGNDSSRTEESLLGNVREHRHSTL